MSHAIQTLLEFAPMTDQDKSKQQLIEELANLRQNFDALANYLPEGFLIVDSQVKVLAASRHCLQSLGVTREEFEGVQGSKHFEYYKIYHTNGVPAKVEQLPLARAVHFGEVISNEEWIMETRVGRRYPILCQSGPVRDRQGAIIGAVISWHDISDRNRAEKDLEKAREELEQRVEERTAELIEANRRLQQSNDELQAIYENMTDGIVIIDAATLHPVRANQALCRMIGWPEEEIRSVTPEAIHPPEVMPLVREHFDTVSGGSIAKSESFPIIRKDGTMIYADIVSIQIFYNEQPGWISFFHDVTERKRAEESQKREFRTLKHLLQSSDHERQTIAYDIHDGLAQYLAAAIMQFDVYKHSLEKTPNEAEKAYDIAASLLQQGHFEARRLIAGVRPPVLDEAGVVEAVAHLINEQNREKGPQIEFISKVKFSRLVPILENAIYRICQEGLANACKHSNSDKVRIALIQRNNTIRIDIRDWGKGFSRKKIKESCYGLAGIRERARLLGGKFRILSVAEKGSRIRVELPLMAKEG